MKTTPTGVPITLCDECHREHPQGKRHCEIAARRLSQDAFDFTEATA